MLFILVALKRFNDGDIYRQLCCCIYGFQLRDNAGNAYGFGAGLLQDLIDIATTAKNVAQSRVAFLIVA